MHSIPNKLILAFCYIIAPVTLFSQAKGSFEKAADQYDLVMEMSYCDRNLDEARVLFEKGYLEDIVVLLEPCVENKNNWSNQSAALKLLTETYLFLGQELKADTAYQKLLMLDPGYQPTKNVDHPELVFHAEKFVTVPKFGYGVKLGYIFPSVDNRKTYFLEDSLASVADNYEGISKLQFGLFSYFNVNKSNFEIAPSLLFTNMGYKLTTDMLYNEPNITGNLTFEEHLRFLDLGVNLKYNFKPFLFPIKPKKYASPITTTFYVSAGLTLNYLYYAKMEDLNFSKTDVSNGIVFIDKQQSTGLDLLEGSSPLRNTLNYSYNAAAGFKISFAKAFWVFDFRYNGMINSIVNADNRYSNEGLQRIFRHVDNDIALNSFVISVGFGFTLSHSVKKVKP